MLTFALSQGLDSASKAAAGVSGGLGLVAAFGADRVKAMAEDHINALTEEFAGVKGKKALQEKFQFRMERGFEDVMAAALWADPRVRQRLLATPGVTPPDPKFLDADGNLRPPPPGTDAYDKYRRDWLETKASKDKGLLGMARSCLERSGLTTQYYQGLATALFTE